MSEIAFVNIHGQTVDTTKRVKLEKRTSTAPSEFHKGYAVQGIEPGVMEEARADYNKKRDSAMHEGLKDVPEAWSELAWLRKAKFKRVRTKPYELYSAASECKALAEKAGWLHVRVQTLSSEA